MTTPDKKILTRRRFLQGAASGAAGVAAATMASKCSLPLFAATASNRPPNLLFIQSDQMGIRALSGHGCAFVQTPNIDRLMKRGTSFRLSYSGNPVCCPARSVWYTGRPSCETGVVQNEWPIAENMPDLGQWFSARGYEAVYAGKWHIPGRDFQKSFKVLTPGYGAGEHGDAAVSRAAQGFLSSYRGDKPFFLSLGFLQPHDICYWAWHHAARMEELPFPQIAGKLPPLPGSFEFDPREPQYMRRVWREGKGWAFLREWSELNWRYYIWSYYRHVEMVDAEIGRVLDALEDGGLAENTVVIFTTDHGDGMGCHKTVQKMFLYDEAAAVPFVASCPGRIAEGVQDQTHLVSGMDLAPTLCDYAGIETPPKARGKSLRPLLEKKPVEWRDFLVSESATTGRMVRTVDYKLITYKNDPVEQLFDMKADPWETRNLAEEAKYADTMADLKKRLAAWESQLEPLPLEGRQPPPRKPAGAQQPQGPGGRPAQGQGLGAGLGKRT
ncbi:MAG: sulfatase-like hydrolase/transferase [Candidatus Sumerlaeota bacterium]|nr:sulfatase-like hydrolase/transferase [Candidatus Sumerlaeota bacterium]